MLDRNSVVNVVVSQKPQRVFAVVNDQMHVGRWKTVEPGENGVTPIDDKSNANLLNAAMMFWSGESHFTTTVQELEDHSGGWGVD